MKKNIIFALLIGLAALVVIAGCGMVSATLFMSKQINEPFEANVNPTLDAFVLTPHVVDFSNSKGFDKVKIEGIEDACLHFTVHNLTSSPIEAAVYVTPDTITTNIHSQHDLDSLGFPILPQIHVAGNDSTMLTCAETLPLMTNLSHLADLVASGKFVAWVAGNTSSYHIKFDGIVMGVHVTGSMK